MFLISFSFDCASVGLSYFSAPTASANFLGSFVNVWILGLSFLVYWLEFVSVAAIKETLVLKQNIKSIYHAFQKM